MVIWMDMTSGTRMEDVPEEYGDEVLNANWLPQPELQLGLQPVHAETRGCDSPLDVEEFLRAVYCFQE